MRIGSLFSGAGGLDMAIGHVFGATTAWHCEVDPAASKVLAHRWPGVPNLGDITQVDWAAVEPVDVLCGGFPCQDVSSAGRRAGIKTGTRSGLWSYFTDAIDVLRPAIICIENVRGLLSARAHRDMERNDPIMGNSADGFVLRAAGAVLGDLADLGYDAQWATVAASDVGAPHRRERVFVVAHTQRIGQQRPAHNSPSGQSDVAGGDLRLQHDRCATTSTRGPHRERRLAADTAGDGLNGRAWTNSKPYRCGECQCGTDVNGCAGKAHGTHAHSPRDGRHEGRPEPARLVGGSDAALSGAGPVELLPTPVVNDMGDGKTVDWWDNWTAEKKRQHGNGNGHGNSLAIEVQRALLPTPAARESGASPEAWDTFVERHKAKGYNGNGHGDSLAVEVQRVARGDLLATPQAHDAHGMPGNDGFNQKNLCRDVDRMGDGWGKYEPAIRRWETLTRPAPSPTEPNTKGNPRLVAAFSEWLMGWPADWVTAVPGISRNDQLRIIGNGVCPQQAVAALRWLLSVSEAVA